MHHMIGRTPAWRKGGKVVRRTTRGRGEGPSLVPDVEAIKAARTARGISLDAVAAEAGVAPQTVGRLVRGTTKRVTADVLERVAYALRVPVSTLVAPE